MKFLSLYLKNYIGIYNGMQRHDIFIDFTRCKHRMIIIRGDNGSGKSTIMKSLTVFPDSNDQFIPDKPAEKEIILLDNGTMYRCKFIHGIKNNGERDTTKAYIFKTINGQEFSLNENGNVSSFKDIIYDELELDPNFMALSQLSSDDRGLADKKPAERKKTVISVMQTLEAYNAMNKSLSKKSTGLKSTFNSLMAKLGSIGDINELQLRLKAIQSKIDLKQKAIDKTKEAISIERSTITVLDPDGSITSQNEVITKRLDELVISLKQQDTIMSNILKTVPFALNQENYEWLENSINSLNTDSIILRTRLDGLIADKESRAAQLVQKSQRLQMLYNESNYEDIVDQIAINKTMMDEIQNKISQSGIQNALSFTRDEYIIALETLKDVYTHLDVLRSFCSFDIMKSVSSYYLENGELPVVIDIQDIQNKINEAENTVSSNEKEYEAYKTKAQICDKLSLRPDTCIDDTCNFIADAVQYAKEDPVGNMQRIEEQISDLKGIIAELKFEMEYAKDYNQCVNEFRQILREVNKNKSILTKLPNGDLFKNKQAFIDDLLSGRYIDYVNGIYKFIDIANLFDEYKKLYDIVTALESDKRMYDDKQSVAEGMQEEINNLNSEIVDIVGQVEPINTRIHSNAIKLQELNGYLAQLDMYKKALLDSEPIVKEWNSLQNQRNTNIDKIKRITEALKTIESLNVEKNEFEKSIAPDIQDKELVERQIYLAESYQKELDEVNRDYNFIETIKKYSSPTTGIQIVFIDIYMGTVIETANRLLSLLFNGEYVVGKPIIDESGFRIPCIGSGYPNDDISSMSGAQIAMISMILSFSLLCTSSTKYNIIKLDEIDAPLDAGNRIAFIDVANSIMDIMGTEQCFIISHNSELQTEDADIILLKSSNDNSEYEMGNIIWKY